MADNGNEQQNQNNSGDLQLQDLQYSNDTQKNIETSLRYIVSALQKNPNLLGRNNNPTTQSQSRYSQGSKWNFSRENPNRVKSKSNYRSTGNLLSDVENGIRDSLLESIGGSNFKKGLNSALNTFTKEFGVNLNQIPHEMGKALGKKAIKALSDIQIGDKGKLGDVAKNFAKDKITKYGGKALDFLGKQGADGAAAKDALLKVGQSFLKGSGNGGGVLGDLFGEVLGKGGSAVAKGAATKGAATVATSGATTAATTAAGGSALSGLASGGMAALASIPVYGWIIAAVIAIVAICFKPVIGALLNMVKALGKSFNREEEIRKKRAENAQKRLEADMEWMAKRPFEILQQAAEEWQSTWDSNLNKIGQTQGYDKESVYALFEGYAERLRGEDLGSIINATDIVTKLSSVLDTGLSGPVAEEFAYIATKLNAAIPTQDFFGYAETYASIAANAISQGKSQSEAIGEANQQLQEFASNLLYSSRELAGGFSTGLKNSSDLFKQATQIAQAAKTYNATEISGTLTSVSAIIGAVAPDLAGSLVDNIVQAAIGGNNNSSIVALRSLAGINAGNTEFLKALATDSQSVFSTLFNNLANLQNMSTDNYMEVAEGLSDVFGIDKSAFARVDFNYLAQAISEMNINNTALQDNLDLLISGQTKTSEEQLKAQEVNQVILDEGLAYVIDSEAGRMVQQHMWDEQMKNAMMENEYAVSLQGSALEFLEGIRQTTTNLLHFLNPTGFITKGIANLTQSVTDAISNQQDLEEILKLGAVGSNTKSYNNLVTRGKDLNLTTSLVEMMGGTKGDAVLNFVNGYTQLWGTSTSLADSFNWVNDQTRGGGLTAALTMAHPATGLAMGLYNKVSEWFDTNDNAISSRYTWNTVGKSVAKAIQSTPFNTNSLLGGVISTAADATKNAQEAANAKFQEFLDTAEEMSKTLSFEHWVETAKDMGISDFTEALKSYGRTEEEVRGYFEANQAQEGARQEAARKEDEQLFRDQNRGFWDYESGTSGIFQSAIWFPFFGKGQQYDTRMDALDLALSDIQNRIGANANHTVISGLEELSSKLGDNGTYTVISGLEQIHKDISTTFISSSSTFQKCLADWTRYIAASSTYTGTISRSSAWSDLQNAEKDQQTEATLALANALGIFSAEELKKMDPQLQTNVLLGEIVVILQAIMQQNNSVAGGLSLIDTISALGLGMTNNTTT